MRTIFIMLLSTVLASAHAADEPEGFPVEAFCQQGKLIGLRMEAPTAGVITIPIPPGVCDADKKPAAPPPPKPEPKREPQVKPAPRFSI